MKILLFSTLLIIMNTFLLSQESWELQKEDDGIKIYTSPVQGSDIKAFKAVTLINARLSTIVAVLRDVSNFSELYETNKFAEIIEENDTVLIQYVQTNIPWPATDRDGVYKNTFSQHYGTKTVTIKVETVDGLIPEKKGFVRMENATGYWELHPVGAEAVEITHQMHAEPGGGIPSWIINMFLVDSPLKDLKNLKERVQLEIYQNRQYEFLVDY